MYYLISYLSPFYLATTPIDRVALAKTFGSIRVHFQGSHRGLELAPQSSPTLA
jgi:hypothetical protein